MNKLGVSLILSLMVILFADALSARERSLFVWGKGPEIILNESETDKTDFWSFVTAPHGNPDAKITTLFMHIGTDLITDYPDRLREFIADLHSRGMKIEFLSGQKKWAITTVDNDTGEPYNQPALDLVDTIMDYNDASLPEEQFDGIHLDIEPHTIDTSDNIRKLDGSCYIFEDDTAEIWDQLLDTLTAIQTKIDTRNPSDTVTFTVDTVFWLDEDWNANGKTDHKDIQDIVDRVAIMNYSVRPGTEDRVAKEISYGDNDSVWVGFETFELGWKERVVDYDIYYQHPEDDAYFFLTHVSHWGVGVEWLETSIENTEAAYVDNDSYIGPFIHFYEDLINGESAYRQLGLEQENSAPVVQIIYPSGKEILSGTDTIIYIAEDIDGDALSITLSYKLEGTSTWIDIAGSAINTGTHVFDASALSGAYKIKIEAVETQVDGLSGFDMSDYTFSVVPTTLDYRSPEAGTAQIYLIKTYPVKRAHISWDSFVDPNNDGNASGIKGYYYSLDGLEPKKFTTANSAYISGLGDVTVYVRAIDCSGNLSNYISGTIHFYSDTDGDGLANEIDNDIDGDGISNEEEEASFTDPEDDASYPLDKMVVAFEFDGSNLTNNLLTTFFISEQSLADTTAYETNPISYSGDKSYSFHTGVPYGDEKIHFPTGLVLSENILDSQITALTVEMWIKPNATDYFVPLMFVGDTDYGFSMFLQHTVKHLQLRFYNSGNIRTTSYSGVSYKNDSLYDGNWHHIAFSYVYGENRHLIKLYVDGEEVGRINKYGSEPLSISDKIRFLDATSKYDGYWDGYNEETHVTRNSNLAIENSSQCQITKTLGGNNWWQIEDFGVVKYIGEIDDIRITKVALPPEELGWNKRAVSSASDTDNDGLNDFMETVYYKSNPNDNDSDNDGISDNDEVSTHHTSPTKADTDNDLIPDQWEIANGLNPLYNDADNDGDNDGLSNLGEFANGTNPSDNDSDNDGLLDGWEVNNNTNPLVFDSDIDNDNDGLNNMCECTHSTDPINPDSDNDGMNDGDEVYAGMNPNDSESIFSIVSTELERVSEGIKITWNATDQQGRTYKIYWRNLSDSLWDEVDYEGFEDDIISVPENGTKYWIDMGIDEQMNGESSRIYKVLVFIE